MSAMEIASSSAKFSYQRLKNEGGFAENDEREERVIGRTRSRPKFRKVSFNKRPKIRIPGLRRFLRRKARIFSDIRVTCCRVLKRLKDNQSHMGDLFAGNYLFMQIIPTSFKCVEKSFKGLHLHDLSSTSTVRRIA